MNITEDDQDSSKNQQYMDTASYGSQMEKGAVHKCANRRALSFDGKK